METVTDKKIVFVDVDKITPAAFNPPKRTSTTDIRELKESIEEVGLVYPLVVDEHYNLIDGHRRLTCIKALNWKAAPVLVAKTDSKRLFDHVNRTAQRLSRKDELYIFLSGGPISERAKKSIEKLQTYLDQKDLEYAAENRVSHSGLVFSIVHLTTYLEKAGIKVNAAFQKKAVKYIMYNSQSFAIRRAIAGDIEPRLVVAAIETNTPLS